MLGAFPVFAASCIFNAIWLVRIILKRGTRPQQAVVWLLCVGAWYCAHRYDVYRSDPGGFPEPSPGRVNAEGSADG
jgi:hypothetical protein